jgi:hypothetical protein
MLIIFLIVTVVSSNPESANESALTLPKIIEYSLHNNGDLKSLREEKGIRDAGKVKAGLLPNPTLDLKASTGALTGSNNENSLGLGCRRRLESITIKDGSVLAGQRGKNEKPIFEIALRPNGSDVMGDGQEAGCRAFHNLFCHHQFLFSRGELLSGLHSYGG